MKFYMYLVALLFVVGSVLGFILPALISAKSTELVILGLGVVVATPPLLAFILKRLFNEFDLLLNKEGDNEDE